MIVWGAGGGGGGGGAQPDHTHISLMRVWSGGIDQLYENPGSGSVGIISGNKTLGRALTRALTNGAWLSKLINET